MDMEEEIKKAKNLEISEIGAYFERLASSEFGSYEGAAEAMVIGMIAGIETLASHHNVSGTQFNWAFGQGCVHLKCMDKDLGLMMREVDHLLYPQYKGEFVSIRKSTFVALQKKAAENLKNSCYAVERVKDHWLSIVKGVVPFGLKLRNNE